MLHRLIVMNRLQCLRLLEVIQLRTMMPTPKVRQPVRILAALPVVVKRRKLNQAVAKCILRHVKVKGAVVKRGLHHVHLFVVQYWVEIR